MGKLLTLASLLFFCTLANAQNNQELSAGYYTVVGAFDKSKEDFAKRFVQVLNQKGLQAQYGYNSSRALHFVYVQNHPDLKSALEYLYKFRESSEYKDAWIRVVPGVIGQKGEEARPVMPAEVVAPVEESKSIAKAATPVKGSEPEVKKQEEVKLAEAPVVVTETPKEVTADYEGPEEKIIQVYPMNLGNSDIFLSLFNASNNRIIDGEVQVIDTDRGRLLKTVKGNEYLTFPDPKNNTGKITLICDVFGYRKLQHEINYANPAADTVLPYVDMMGLSFVVNFDLVRYRKGDLQTLSHVYFFNDAAVMIPESRYEVNQLLQMMTESPQMKIRLHGHTNGHYHGKIIKMGPEKNFFSVGKDAVSTVGSAKDLSFERAEIIKEYLIANGIAENRIEVKGWGGKKPLFDKHSANARKNVRVEVEVIAD